MAADARRFYGYGECISYERRQCHAECYIGLHLVCVYVSTTEHGKFLALDLGGTNFRVLLIELGGDNREPTKFKMQSKIFAIPQNIMLGPGDSVSSELVPSVPCYRSLCHFLILINIFYRFLPVI